jgi:hypothetical protein
VQLQQVAMNLTVNSIEAMKEVDGMREMLIKSPRDENEQVLVSFSDTGVGLPPTAPAWGCASAGQSSSLVREFKPAGCTRRH